MEIIALSVYVLTSGVLSGLLLLADLVVSPPVSPREVRRRIHLSLAPGYLLAGIVVVWTNPESWPLLMMAVSAINGALIPGVVVKLRKRRLRFPGNENGLGQRDGG